MTALFEEFLAKHGYQEDLCSRLAEACLQTGDIARAMQLLRQVQDNVNGPRPFLSGQLAVMHERENKPEEAINAYKLTIKNRPDESFYYFRLARLYCSQGQFSEAKDVMQKLNTIKNNLSQKEEAEESEIVAKIQSELE